MGSEGGLGGGFCLFCAFLLAAAAASSSSSWKELPGRRVLPNPTEARTAWFALMFSRRSSSMAVRLRVEEEDGAEEAADEDDEAEEEPAMACFRLG